MWARICALKRELSDKEQTLSKAHREKEELCHEKEDLEARLQSYKGQQRHMCIPCRSCSLCKPVRICTCTGSPISTGDISATKVFNDLQVKHMFYSYFNLNLRRQCSNVWNENEIRLERMLSD